MTSFRKYFTHHFKSTLLRCAILAVLALLLTVTFVEFNIDKSYHGYLDQGTGLFITTSLASWGNIKILGYIAAAVATVLPVLELFEFKNRRNMDTLLFLPISRWKMALAHYLNGISHILIINGVCFLVTTLMMIPYDAHFYIEGMMPFYGAMMLACVALYSLFLFAFMQANTLFDGVIFMGAYSVVGLLIVDALIEARPKLWVCFDEDYFFVYNPIEMITQYFNDIVTPKIEYSTTEGINHVLDYISSPWWETEATNALFCWGFVSIAAIFGYFYFFEKQRPEQIGGISNSWFGYKVLIPICALTVAPIMDLDNEEQILIIIAMFIAYILYRRSLRFKKSDFVVMGIISLLIIADIFDFFSIFEFLASIGEPVNEE